MMRVTRKVRLRSSCLLCIAAQSNNLLQFILLFYPVHSAILFLSMYLHLYVVRACIFCFVYHEFVDKNITVNWLLDIGLSCYHVLHTHMLVCFYLIQKLK
jgi:hypothetical protein